MGVLKHPPKNTRAVTSETAVPLITSFLDHLCRPEGYDTTELEGICGFRFQYHRLGKGGTKLRFPSHVRFINLNDKVGGSVDRSNFNFVVGLCRTPQDPKSGRVVNYWSFDNPSNTIDSNDVTAFVAFRLSLQPNPLLKVKTLQAATIREDDRQLVVDELRTLGDPANTGGRLAARIKSHEEWGVPWAFQERLMVFAPVTILLARNIGVDSVQVRQELTEESVSPDSRPSINYDRLFSTLSKFPHEGIKITP